MFTSAVLRRYTILAALAALTGCSRASADQTAAESRDTVFRALGDAISEEVGDARAERFACGAPGDRPEAVLIASARQCMGCRDIAWLIRDAQRRTSTREPVWVLTSPQDAEKVCRYLAEERSPAPVYMASPRALAIPADNDDLVLVEFDSSGHRLFHAHDALLLENARAGGTGAAPARDP